MERMSITRALSEKKLLGKRIEQHFSKFKPLAVVVGDNLPPGFKSINEFDEYAKSSCDQIRDELDRYARIVQAIADSNSRTKVVICGQEYTVARALEKKKFYATVASGYLEDLQDFFASRQREYEELLQSEKAKEDREFDTFVGKDKGLREDELKAARKIIADRHKVRFIDPLGIREIIEKMDREQSSFLLNVDIVLTESNSRTEIDI